MSFTPLFYALLKLYHTFPLHSPVTLLYMDAPWGRFAYNQQRGREGRRAWGDLDGNLAWAFMEIVSVSHQSCEWRMEADERTANHVHDDHPSVRGILETLLADGRGSRTSPSYAPHTHLITRRSACFSFTMPTVPSSRPSFSLRNAARSISGSRAPRYSSTCSTDT